MALVVLSFSLSGGGDVISLGSESPSLGGGIVAPVAGTLRGNTS